MFAWTNLRAAASVKERARAAVSDGARKVQPIEPAANIARGHAMAPSAAVSRCRNARSRS